MPTRAAVRAWRIPTATTLTWLLASCNAATEGPPSPRALTLQVSVVDSVGAPAPGSLVVSYVWPDPSLPAPPRDPDERTDFSGRLRLALGTFGGGEFDSLRLIVQTRGCESGTEYDFRLRQADLRDEGGDTLGVELVVPAPPPAASARVGHLCAFGVHPAWGPRREYWFSLLVDSVTGDLLSGEWSISHSASYATDWGPFQGTIRGDVVALTLANHIPEAPCAGQLLGTVRADGSWGPLYFSPSEVCEGRPSRLDFAAAP